MVKEQSLVKQLSLSHGCKIGLMTTFTSVFFSSSLDVLVGVSDAFCASVGSFSSRSSKVMYETVMFQKGKMFSIDAGDFQVYFIANGEHLEVLRLDLLIVRKLV
jgi:hypothetical protein